jgi:hypothetical protein
VYSLILDAVTGTPESKGVKKMLKLNPERFHMPAELSLIVKKLHNFF